MKYKHYRSGYSDSESDIEFSGICDISAEVDDKNYPLLLDFGYVQQTIKRIEGKMLTIAEATSDQSKLKAVKDLIRSAFSIEHQDLYKDVNVNGTFLEEDIRHTNEKTK